MKVFNNRIFYDANRAHEMTDSVNDERIIKQLNEVYDKIDAYIKAGEYKCQFVGLTDIQKSYLIEQGYTVYEDGDEIYVIEW